MERPETVRTGDLSAGIVKHHPLEIVLVHRQSVLELKLIVLARERHAHAEVVDRLLDRGEKLEEVVRREAEGHAEGAVAFLAGSRVLRDEIDLRYRRELEAEVSRVPAHTDVVQLPRGGLPPASLPRWASDVTLRTQRVFADAAPQDSPDLKQSRGSRAYFTSWYSADPLLSSRTAFRTFLPLESTVNETAPAPPSELLKRNLPSTSSNLPLVLRGG